MGTKKRIIYTDNNTGKISNDFINIPALMPLLGLQTTNTNIVAIPLHRNINEMSTNSVYPNFGVTQTDFVTLPISERFLLEPLGGNYRATEIRARLVNANSTPMTLEIEINGTVLTLNNVIYSNVLTIYPIPTANQSTVQTAKIQAGFFGNNINNILEMYIIYTKI